MFRRKNAPIPVGKQPVPVFVKLVAVLLKNVQKIASPEKRMSCHNQHKTENQDINEV